MLTLSEVPITTLCTNQCNCYINIVLKLYTLILERLFSLNDIDFHYRRQYPIYCSVLRRNEVLLLFLLNNTVFCVCMKLQCDLILVSGDDSKVYQWANVFKNVFFVKVF